MFGKFNMLGRGDNKDRKSKKDSAKKEYLKNQKVVKKDKVDKSRREFLGTSLKVSVGAVALTGAGVGGKFVLDKLEEFANSDEDKEIEYEPTEGQKEIQEQDQEVIGQTVESQLADGGDVVLDKNTKKAIYEKWHESYSPGGENFHGLEESLERMEPWVNEMKEQFRKAGVPEEYVYLSIPESHFDISAVSRKQAGGPFQFTKPSAKGFGLSVGEVLDERFDPVASAEACAKHLAESYERFNNDWDLALADYNGNYTNRYARFRSKKSERSYEDYLAWREGRLNEFLAKGDFSHEVLDGQNLSKIAGLYEISIEQIKKINGLPSDKIIPGQRLKLPDQESVKKIILRDSLENLNYPEKFYAVLDVIEEQRLLREKGNVNFHFEVVDVPSAKVATFSHVMQSGDNLFRVSKKFSERAKAMNSSFDLPVMRIQQEIEKQSKIKDVTKVGVGQKVTVALEVESPMSLADIAKKNETTIAELKKINPAVIKIDKPLPKGVKIRVPKK